MFVLLAPGSASGLRPPGLTPGPEMRHQMNETPDVTRDPDAPAPGEREDLKLGLLDDYIGFHLRLAQNASFRAFKRHTGDRDLRPGWFAVLTLIARQSRASRRWRSAGPAVATSRRSRRSCATSCARS